MFKNKIIFSLFFILFLSTFVFKLCFAERVNAVYGLNFESGIFSNMTFSDMAEYLDRNGVNAIIKVPLNRKLIRKLNDKGIKTYAEISVFFGKEYWDKYPESRPVLSDGSFMEGDSWYFGVCASWDWLVDKKVEEVKYVASNYDIDGVWLDFIRWPTRWEVSEPRIDNSCFCPRCLIKFQDDTGVNIPNNLTEVIEISKWIHKNYSQQWHEWRCDVIVKVVRKIKLALNDCKKDAVLGIFLVPWVNGDFNNAMYKIIGQDVIKLSSVVDVFSPMSYHRLLGKPISWITKVNKKLKSNLDNDILPIVQWSKGMGQGEYLKSLEAASGGGASGVISFVSGAKFNKPEFWDAFGSIINDNGQSR